MVTRILHDECMSEPVRACFSRPRRTSRASASLFSLANFWATGSFSSTTAEQSTSILTIWPLPSTMISLNLESLVSIFFDFFSDIFTKEKLDLLTEKVEGLFWYFKFTTFCLCTNLIDVCDEEWFGFFGENSSVYCTDCFSARLFSCRQNNPKLFSCYQPIRNL